MDVAAGALALLGCATSPPGLPPFAASATATVLATAGTDLGCPAERLAIALELYGTVSKGTARFLVDGCGERALYVEACQEAPPDQRWVLIADYSGLYCRYFITSRFPLVGPASDGGTPADAASPRGPAGPAR
jgi:hypothetical protein